MVPIPIITRGYPGIFAYGYDDSCDLETHPLTLDVMTYGIPVYGMTSEKTVPRAEVVLPAIAFFRNFERVEGQQDQEDW